MKKQKGFTLIELLVVIAIIGLLSTIAIVAMGGARAKARDAKRISDIKQMSTVLDVEEAAAPGTALLGCVAVNAKTNLCSNAGDITTSFGATSGTNMCDPTGKCAGVACANLGTAGCDYSISTSVGLANPTTANYRICFYLESANLYGAASLYKIVNGGAVTAGCP